MLEPKRIETNQKPNVIEYLGNNTYYYNYDIQSNTVCVSHEDGTSTDEQRWNFIQIHLSGVPEYKTCAKTIIRQYIDEESEFSFINDFNAYQLGIIKDSKAYSDYIDYIKLISEIKEKVKADLCIM